MLPGIQVYRSPGAALRKLEDTYVKAARQNVRHGLWLTVMYETALKKNLLN